MKWTLRSIVLAALLCAGAAEPVREKERDGNPKHTPSEAERDRRDGVYTEYYISGKIKRQARFKVGKLEGLYTENNEDGEKRLTANYKGGKLHGTLTRYEKGRPVLTQRFKDGVPVFAKSVAQIKQRLAEINTSDKEQQDPVATDREAALRRLKAYRYLTDVPYRNLVLNEEMNQGAQAACRICAKLGRMDHSPTNPGMPEAEFQRAFKGANSSNLAMGYGNMEKAVEGWMDDSDGRNIAHLGHRRWCLHPLMRQVGFGKEGGFQAMWAFDASQPKVPDFNFVSYPARGFMPVEYFGASYAWSVSLNPRRYQKPGPEVKPKLYRLGPLLSKVGDPLKLNHSTVDAKAYGIANCIIFRPEHIEVKAGKRYLVVIEGLRRKGGKPAVLRYVVEFVSLK
jgi:hypothetical protein